MAGTGDIWADAGDLAIAFVGNEPAAAVAPLARIAEAGGAGGIWLANHLFQRDPVVQAAVALAATTDIRCALMAISPYLVHPVQAAMTAASLDEHFPGRVTLSLGTGAPGDLAAAGVERPRPLRTLAESLAVTRALLAGEAIDHDGEVFQVRGRTLETGARPVPLVLAAMGPGMLRLAGEAADGVVLSAACSIPFVEASLARVRAAAGGRRVRAIGLVLASVDDVGTRAYDRLRPLLAFILRGAHHKANLEAAGLVLDQAALSEATATGDWDGAAGLIGDEVVAALTASGRPAQVRDAIAAYRAAGLDEVVLTDYSMTPAELTAVLDAVRGV